jgi:hypothetical protein
MDELRACVWRERDRFTFDHHVDDLIAFLRQVAANRNGHLTSTGTVPGGCGSPSEPGADQFGHRAD